MADEAASQILTEQQQQQMLAASLAIPVPRIYLNGFQIAQSFADVMLVTQANGSPSAVLNMSFTTAKSLAEELATMISNLETNTQQPIMTMRDVQERQEAGRSK